jgi:hypothetical protein
VARALAFWSLDRRAWSQDGGGKISVGVVWRGQGDQPDNQITGQAISTDEACWRLNREGDKRSRGCLPREELQLEIEPGINMDIGMDGGVWIRYWMASVAIS